MLLKSMIMPTFYRWGARQKNKWWPISIRLAMHRRATSYVVLLRVCHPICAMAALRWQKEVRAAGLANVKQPHQASKLINKLAWRYYFLRVYSVVGSDIWSELEAYKAGSQAKSYTEWLLSVTLSQNRFDQVSMGVKRGRSVPALSHTVLRF